MQKKLFKSLIKIQSQNLNLFKLDKIFYNYHILDGYPGIKFFLPSFDRTKESMTPDDNNFFLKTKNYIKKGLFKPQ